MKSSIELHVFGGPVGETILIRFPNGDWGAVDWYASRQGRRTPDGPTRLLRRNGVSELVFVCWTHAHLDHCRGMAKLLTDFTVREFWRFGSATSSDIWLARLQHARSLAFGFAEEGECASEVESILRIARQRRTARDAQPGVERRVLASQRLFRTRGRHPVEVWSVAPSGQAVADFEDRVYGSFDQNAYVGRSYTPRANDVSVGLVVHYGYSRILLGGDVETPEWRRAVALESSHLGGITVVKVPHHGSAGAHYPDLWRTMGSRPKCAIVTSFSPQKLPEASTLSKLLQRGTRVFLVCPGPWLERKRRATQISPADLRVVLARRSLEKRPVSSDRGGHVIVRCDYSGKVRVRLSGSAERRR